MSFRPPQATRWNIFARELDDILRAHKLWIGKLDDIGIVYHPEKVRRLKRSLTSAASFPTLNPEELERLEAKVPLTPDERARLRAALAAAAVERTLMDREDPATALMAADDVFHILLARLRVQPDSPLAAVRGDVGFVEDEEAGDHYAAVWDGIDRGMLALHAARRAAGRARAVNASAARVHFRQALRMLADIEAPEARAPEVIAGHDEATRGEAAANALAESPRDGGGE